MNSIEADLFGRGCHVTECNVHLSLCVTLSLLLWVVDVVDAVDAVDTR